MSVAPARPRLRRLGALLAGGALVAAGLLAPAISAQARTAADPDLSGFTAKTIYQADIQDHESDGEVTGNYDAWHIGSGLAGEKYRITSSNVLQLISPATANGHAVQLLKGYTNDGNRPTDLHALIAGGAAVETTGDNAAHFQIAYHWGTDENPNAKFGTLYPVNPTVGMNIVAEDQLWKTTKAIGTTYAANASDTLGNLVDALEAQPHFTVSGFGAATDGTNSVTTQITAIWWDHTKYTFAPADFSGATAHTVYQADIQDHESDGELPGNYDAWHIGSGLAGEKYRVSGSGVLQLISPAVANGHAVQLLKGYTNDGTRPTNLLQLINKGAAVESTGDNPAHFQIAFHWGPDGTPNAKFGTLYPVSPTVGLNVVSLDQIWKTTKAIGNPVVIPANTAAPLGDLIDALQAQPNFTVSGFGAATDGTSGVTTQITAIWWDGAKYTFAKAHAADLSGDSTQVVYQADIQDHESDGELVGNYDAWHIGSGLAGEGFSVTNGGVLQLVSPATAGGHAVQLLKGYPSNAARPSDLFGFIESGAAVESTGTSPAHFQIAFHWGPDGSPNAKFGTLYPVNPTVGLNIAAMDQIWKTTKAIGDPVVIPANTAAPLGDLIDALEAQPNFTVSGFGAATDGTPSVTTQITAIWWDGVKYTFANAKPVAVNVTGTVAVGRTLTASHLEWNAGATYSYQWYRGTKAISGAKSKTYLVAAADYGQTLKVKVTAVKTGTATTSATSPSTAKVAKGTIAVTGALSITGNAKVGVKLIASLPTFDVQQDVAGNQSGVTVTYQWYRGASKISGATKGAYTLTASDLGSAITVKATVSRSGYTSVPLTSAATPEVIKGVLAVTAAPTVKSTVKGGAFVAGKKVTASSTGWTANGVATKSVTLRYFWFVYDASDPATVPTVGDLVSVTTTGSYTLPSWTKGQGLSVAVYVVGTATGYTGVQSGLSLAHAIQ